MGEEAEKIYSTFTIVTTPPRNGQNPPDPPLTTFDDVVKMFDRHFNPQVNVIHERAVFYQRSQHQGENVETYLRVLYDLAEHADFENKDSAIRDRLVVGLVDRELSEKLQLQATLTLKDAIQMARQHEQVKTQLQEQRHDIKGTVDAVARRGVGHRGRGHRGGNFSGGRGGASGGGNHGQFRPFSGASRGQGQRRGRGGSAPTFNNSCSKCGRTHDADSCPARGKKCRSCSKIGHFAAVCRSVRAVQVEEDYEYDSSSDEGGLYVLGAVTKSGESEVPSTHLIEKVGVQQNCSPWLTTLRFSGQDMTFKIDTGADVTVMSTGDYQKLVPQPKLEPSTAQLTSPGGALKCEGQFDTDVVRRSQNFPLRVFVVSGKTDNLLSREASMRMGLVQKIDTIEQPFGELDDRPVQCPPVKIILKEDAQPYSLSTARRVPIPLLDKVKEELARMERCGVIEAIDDPTDWCAGMVTVMKKSGAVRICTDFKKLNLAVKRERYVIPTLEDLLRKLDGSAVFSKLDATSGFWQLPLDPATAQLTTFITPFGRYFYHRLPFGISSAPEIFQKTMETLLKDEKNVICYFDDIVVHSVNETEHEEDLKNVMKRLTDANLKLNKEKCELRKKEIEFLGHRISKDGVSPDPAKIAAITSLAAPTNVTELRRILGMVNFLGRFIPHLSTILHPMTELLEKDRAWSWGPAQDSSFSKVKDLLTSTPTLAFYDPSRPTVVSADSSSYGIGGVLLQKHQDILRPVAYCSRTLNTSERKYAQIEKEMLAGVWACERFQRYLVGLDEFQLETDHKPLVPLINSRDLQDTPLRCQRLLIRLMRFNARAEYTPGHKLKVADALSRSPQEHEEAEKEERRLSNDIEAHLNCVRMSWQASDRKLEEYAEESRKDPLIQTALRYTREGWPKYQSDVEIGLRELYSVRSELSEYNGLLIKGSRIIVPQALREDTLRRIHDGHLGITKCRERASSSVWWPGINDRIKETVDQCQHCQERRPTERKEPLIPTDLPDRPFQKVGADICEVRGSHYIVVSDYFSRYLEIGHLTSLSSHAVILKLKNMFAHHGIPETVVSDNARQFDSAEFRDFAATWGFQHVTSSPYHAQSNGQAERGVQEAKKILVQRDPMLALLIYRATPTSPTGKSPAELLFGRQIRTTLPTLPANLEPQHDRKALIQHRDQQYKHRNKKNYDRHHGARKLPRLQPGDPVLQKLDHEKKWGNPAVIVKEFAPRSYIIKTPAGKFRRNRRHLRLYRDFKFPSEQPSSDPSNAGIQAGQRHMSCSTPEPGPTPAIPEPKRYPTHPNTPSRPIPVPASRREVERRVTPTRRSQPGSASPILGADSSVPFPVGTPPSGGASPVQSPGGASSGSRSGGGGEGPSATRAAAGNSNSGPVQTTRSGRQVKLPARFND